MRESTSTKNAAQQISATPEFSPSKLDSHHTRVWRNQTFAVPLSFELAHILIRFPFLPQQGERSQTRQCVSSMRGKPRAQSSMPSTGVEDLRLRCVFYRSLMPAKVITQNMSRPNTTHTQRVSVSKVSEIARDRCHPRPKTPQVGFHSRNYPHDNMVGQAVNLIKYVDIQFL